MAGALKSKDSALLELQLEYNNLHQSGVQAVAGAMKGNTSLRRLYVKEEGSTIPNNWYQKDKLNGTKYLHQRFPLFDHDSEDDEEM